MNKLLNSFQNIKPQTKGTILGSTPYHQEDINPDDFLQNNKSSPSQYQAGNKMTYSRTEALKKLPEASSWPKFSCVGEYDHMELIYYIARLFIHVPSIPEYWIIARINTALKEDAVIWYIEMKKKPRQKKLCMVEESNNPEVQYCTFQDVRNRANKWKCSPYEGSSFREKQPLKVDNKDKPRKKVTDVPNKKNSYHIYGSKDYYTNNCPNAKKEIYAIEKVPEEEAQGEYSESDSMGNAIRAKSDDNQDPIEEFLVEFKEEAQLEIQEIQLEEGLL
ncbi:hypothetical protein O181_044528 [Austropuccinia psidii MF-1]|uniref:Uncharacterized protein n=1 Tax=Austropuccinia psidii MF-1 TaxID=1389203 RepID=A0A9Q3DNH6_9BASI|nr:hypothetical protein [Austropuccinia psidii MF-1]